MFAFVFWPGFVSTPKYSNIRLFDPGELSYFISISMNLARVFGSMSQSRSLILQGLSARILRMLTNTVYLGSTVP